MKRFLAFLVSLFCTFMMFNFSIFAEENTVNIDYNARTNEFSVDENQDLFVNLKNVVPGDNITQKINLKVIDLKNGDVVKIYLKAENPNEDYDTLEKLNGVNLTVNRDGENIKEKISNPLLLRSFSENGEVNIDVTLEVDKIVGNEIANLNAKIDWIFSAEIIENTDVPNEDVPNKDMPKTGDDINVEGLVIICIISLGLIFWIIRLRK